MLLSRILLMTIPAYGGCSHHPQYDVAAISAEERNEADLRKAEMEANKVLLSAGGNGWELVVVLFGGENKRRTVRF